MKEPAQNTIADNTARDIEYSSLRLENRASRYNEKPTKAIKMPGKRVGAGTENRTFLFLKRRKALITGIIGIWV